MNLELIYDAKKTLENVAKITPITNAVNIAKDFNLYIKMENLQLTGSFKLRGAYNKIMHLSEEEKSRGIVAASAGNHAQGVGFACQKLGIKATIVMPENAPLAKINATRAYGAEVILYGPTFNEAYNYAKRLVNERGATFIEPYDDELVIAGQGTIGLEILDQIKNLDAVFVPLGGGGLVSGIAYAIKSINKNIKVYGVETKNVPSMHESIKQHHVISLNSANTIADGIAVKRPGDITYNICKDYLDDIIEVSEEDIAKTILLLIEKSKIVSEGAGAIAIAACLHNNLDLKGKNVCCVLSGGNIDVTFLSRIIDYALTKSGRKVEINTIVLDKPGQLEKLISLISKTGANILSINHNRISKNADLGYCEVNLTLETFDFEHIQKIIKELEEKGYKIV